MGVRRIAGTNVGLYVGTTLVACATGATLNVTREMLDAACKGSGDWTEQIPGRKSWSIDLDGVYSIYTAPDAANNVSAIDFFDDLDAGTKITVKFGTEETGDIQFSGDAYVTDFSLDGPDDAEATYSIALQGTGPLTKAVVAA